MKRMKKIVSMVLFGAVLVSSTGCNMIVEEVVDTVVEKTMGENTIAMIQGNLDAVYKGIVSDEYLELLTEGTKEDAEQAYLETMESEADFFAHYWGLYDPEYGESYEDLPEDIRADVLELCKEVFAQTKYEVVESSSLSEGSYSVKVSIEPSYIMKQAEEMYDRYDDLEAFFEEYKYVNVDNMSEGEYSLFMRTYAEIIIQMVRELIPDMKYQDAKTQLLQLDEGEDGLLVINDDDWTRINETLVYYP